MTSGNGLIWADGAVVDAHAATVPVLSHGLQRGSTVFDVLRVVELDDGPAAFGLRPHIVRFLASMDLMGMDRPYAVAELETAVATAVLANPGSSIVKCVAAWAEEAPSLLPESLRPSVWVATLPAPDTGPEVLSLTASEVPKIPSALLPPGLKVAAAYTPGVRAQLAARAAGFDGVVLRSQDGTLAEGVTQSVFVVQGGRLRVPALDTVLDGITRRAVLEVAHDMGITAEIRPVRWDEVEAADELFLCSTNGPVRPIGRLDDRTLAAPGPVTTQLLHAVDRLLAGSHRRSAAWLTPLAPLVETRAA